MLTLADFVLLAAAWKVLYQAQRSHTLAVTGPYSVIRHPQYVAFIAIMFSFLVQWPTILSSCTKLEGATSGTHSRQLMPFLDSAAERLDEPPVAWALLRRYSVDCCR